MRRKNRVAATFLICSALVSLMVGCSSAMVRSVPSDENRDYAFELCDGRQWGYVLPIVGTPEPDFWHRKLNSELPGLGVWMVGPRELHFAIEIRESLKLKFSSLDIQITDSAGVITKLPMFGKVQSVPLSMSQIYPAPQFRVEPAPGESDVYRVFKRNAYFSLVSSNEFELVRSPQVRTQMFDGESLDFNFDGQTMDHLILEAIVEVPQTLTTGSQLDLQTPAFEINGRQFPARRFHFDLNGVPAETLSSCRSASDVFRSQKFLQPD